MVPQPHGDMLCAAPHTTNQISLRVKSMGTVLGRHILFCFLRLQLKLDLTATGSSGKSWILKILYIAADFDLRSGMPAGSDCDKPTHSEYRDHASLQVLTHRLLDAHKPGLVVRTGQQCITALTSLCQLTSPSCFLPFLANCWKP